MKNFDYKKYIKDNPLLKEDRFEDVEHVFSGEPDPEFAEITPFKDDAEIFRDQREEVMMRAEMGIDELLSISKEEAYDVCGEFHGPGIWHDIKKLFRQKI